MEMHQMPAPGSLLIAVRTAPKGNQLVADVYIGKAGHGKFPEYPTNLVVIRGRTQDEIRKLLQNPTIDFQTIIAASQATDLISQL